MYGVSSYGTDEVTVVNKGIFTSCKLNNDCPPWAIYSKKITHDKIKKDLIYENAVLKIYDIPVLYFPKFFHPDPTVERRTGFLQPQFNRSKAIGDSLYLPYFKTLGENKDFTFKPTFFDNKRKIIFQNEYRQKNEKSSFISDFAFLKSYKSSTTNKKKNINHIFLNFEKNLDFQKFKKSDLDIKIEKVNNDTYLKVFENNLFESPVIPKDKNTMHSNLKLNLEHEKYDFTARFDIYESLGIKHSVRFQYVLPSYNFYRNIDLKNINGSLSLESSGSNNLKNTNNLKTTITNDLNYNSKDYYTKKGIKNNFNLYFKNLNVTAKNDSIYNSAIRGWYEYF